MARKADVLNTIEIFSKNLIYNYNLLKKLSNKKKLFPVIKANAYGHGIEECVKILDFKRPIYYAVDSYYEALRIIKISKTSVLIIGPSSPENVKYILERKITLTVTNFFVLDEVVKIKKESKIHIFFNTGMNREGFSKNDLPRILSILKKNKNIILDGILSHFADADNPDNFYTKKQEKIFSEIIDFFEDNNIKIKWIHLGNSAGFLKTKDKRINSFRPGISLYGINPLGNSDVYFKELNELKPVLRFTSTITDIQSLESGSSISYNLTYKTSLETTTALLPVGYHELLDRRLSNIGFFKIDNNFVPILGRVCMNLTVIDITKIPNGSAGDKVVIISEIKEDKNSIENMAKLIGTIPYEILTNIKNTTRRIVV